MPYLLYLSIIMANKDDIIALPHPDLRQRSARVHVITDETLQLIADMKTAALDWEDSRPHELAVALAAVQIDRLERVVIVRDDTDDKKSRRFTVLINPEITKREGRTVREHEGCLSVRDIYGLVPRSERVRVKALDETGREVRIKAEGFLARVLQHEIDHTNGIVFIDHIDHDQEAFFTLAANGELEPLDYDDVAARNIFRD